MTLEEVKEIEPGGADVVRGLLRALESVAADAYRISVSRDEAVPRGATIELVATDSRLQHAAVSIHVADRSSQVWITVGRGLELEVPTSRSETWASTSLGVEAAIEAICSAAVRGNVSERVTLEDDIVRKSEGHITISNQQIPVSTFHGRSSGEHRARESTSAAYDYEPFGATNDDERPTGPSE